MKKIMLLVMTVLAVFCITNVSQVNAFEYNGEYYDPIKDVESFRDEINTLVNKRIVGKKYRVGMMEHRRVVILCDKVSLSYVTLSHEQNFSMGALKGMKTQETTTYEVEDKVTTSKELTLGSARLLSLALNFKDYASAGISDKKTTEITINETKVHAETEITTKEREIEYNFDNLILSAGSTVAVGEVALVATFNAKCFTEENRWIGGWGLVGGTDKTFEATYYPATFTTFIYSKGFGDTVTEFHSLGDIAEK